MTSDNDTTWDEFRDAVNMTAGKLEKWLTHVRKVVGYAKRHLAQRPSGDDQDTAWRYSLMNWGHDPEKK